MRSLLRKAGVGLATGLLIFWCSCERHHPDELHHAKPHHADDAHSKDAHADHAHGAAPHASPSPAARGTPANFFPDKPKP